MRHVFFVMVAADAADAADVAAATNYGVAAAVCDPGPRANNAVLQAPAGRGRFVNEWSR